MDERFRKISREEFLQKYAALHDSIFRFREYGPRNEHFLPEIPFVNKDWEVALLSYGGLLFEDVDFLALMQAALAVGDRELVIICAKEDRGEAESEGKPIVLEQGVVLPWDREALLEAYGKSIVSIFDSHLFGRSGTWGVVSYHDYCFCVGGDEKFMDLFTRKAGGRSALKERFLDYNKALPMISDDLREKILARVGWNR